MTLDRAFFRGGNVNEPLPPTMVPPAPLLEDDQLNGGEFASLTTEDWKLIEPYLLENEQLFRICIEEDLLRNEPPELIYRKIIPKRTEALK